MRDQVEGDLVQFCGIYQRKFPSVAYLNAMAKLAAMDPKLAQGGAGKEIEVPVRVLLVGAVNSSSSDPEQALHAIQGAERVIKQQWRRYKYLPVAAGAIRATFVLEPVVANFYQFPRAKLTHLASTLGKLMAENVWFSRVMLTLENDQQSSLSTLALGQLVTTVFDKTRRYPELANTKYHRDSRSEVPEVAPLQLGAVQVRFHRSLKHLDREAIFSAVLMNQTTKDLSLILRMERSNAPVNKQMWMWMAYAFFSKRARELSALESLSLCNISSMTTADMAAFTAVATSDHPEEKLCGCPHSSFNGREATLKSGAQIHQVNSTQGQPERASPALILPFPAATARTFHDDGESAVVDAIVPGFGRCRVKREDLQFYDELEVNPRPHSVTSLTIRFGDHVQANGLPHFLATVGSSLKALTVDEYMGNLDLNMVMRCCPKLQQLSARKSVVDVKFSFIKSRELVQPIVFPRFSWNDIRELTRSLSDVNNPLAHCVRWLRIRLTNIGGQYWMVRYEPAMDAYLEDLLRMLDSNSDLEYLEVTVPSECHAFKSRFESHHNTPVRRGLQLSRDVKAAFLSVRGVTEGNKRAKSSSQRSPRLLVGDLGQDMLTTIFEFARHRVRRQVYFNEEMDEDTPPEDEADWGEADFGYETPPWLW